MRGAVCLRVLICSTLRQHVDELAEIINGAQNFEKRFEARRSIEGGDLGFQLRYAYNHVRVRTLDELRSRARHFLQTSAFAYGCEMQP